MAALGTTQQLRLGAMNNRQPFGRSGGVSPSEREYRTVCSGEEWVYASSDESVYAVSSSSSSSGRGSSCGSSLSSSDGYLNATDSCCARDSDHYDAVGGDWQRCLATERRRCCLGASPNASTAVARADCSQSRSGWTTSSLLCGVAALLAACSLSSLAACIALTSFSLTRIVPSRDAAAAALIDSRTERPPPAPPPWAGGHSLSQHRALTQLEPAVRYSLDCNAQAGHTQCRPVHKEHIKAESSPLSDYTKHRQPRTFRVFTEGIYHVSAQIAGLVWQPPPTLLRIVIARVTMKSHTVNVTTAHVITAAAGSGDLSAFMAQRGAFSVYTAIAMRFSAGDELQAQAVCLEEPNCVIHVNGSTSYLTLETLN